MDRKNFKSISEKIEKNSIWRGIQCYSGDSVDVFLVRFLLSQIAVTNKPIMIKI